jgi:hypothetical protein
MRWPLTLRRCGGQVERNQTRLLEENKVKASAETLSMLEKVAVEVSMERLPYGARVIFSPGRLNPATIIPCTYMCRCKLVTGADP